MILFMVIGPDKQPKMWTEYAECIYDEHDLTSMVNAGYTFLLNEKKASKAQVLAYKRDAAEGKVPSYVPHTPGETKVKTAEAKSRAVRCVDNGKVYNTQSEAAKDLGIDSAQVSDSIKTGKRRSGYMFERA